MALQMSNAVVSITRGGAVLLAHIPAFIKQPGPENMSPEGLIVTSTVLLDPLPEGVTVKTGDQLVLESMGGQAGIGQIALRDITTSTPVPVAEGFEELAVHRLLLEGTIQ